MKYLLLLNQVQMDNLNYTRYLEFLSPLGGEYQNMTKNIAWNKNWTWTRSEQMYYEFKKDNPSGKKMMQESATFLNLFKG